MQDARRLTFYLNYASVAQLVVRNLAKVEVTGSNPVTRSNIKLYKRGLNSLDLLKSKSDTKSKSTNAICGYEFATCKEIFCKIYLYSSR